MEPAGDLLHGGTPDQAKGTSDPVMVLPDLAPDNPQRRPDRHERSKPWENQPR
jgi:hypothetical protein